MVIKIWGCFFGVKDGKIKIYIWVQHGAFKLTWLCKKKCFYYIFISNPVIVIVPFSAIGELSRLDSFNLQSPLARTLWLSCQGFGFKGIQTERTYTPMEHCRASNEQPGSKCLFSSGKICSNKGLFFCSLYFSGKKKIKTSKPIFTDSKHVMSTAALMVTYPVQLSTFQPLNEPGLYLHPTAKRVSHTASGLWQQACICLFDRRVNNRLLIRLFIQQ